MRTRSQARRRRQPQVRQTSVESSNLEKPDNPPIVTMADNRTMAQLLEAPTEGYEDAIEAWDRFNDLLRGCPHHGFSELHQLDTFYNALNSNDQDSLNSAAGAVVAKNEKYKLFQPRQSHLMLLNSKTCLIQLLLPVLELFPVTLLPPKGSLKGSLTRRWWGGSLREDRKQSIMTSS
ncbi:hypothetical protein Tco_0803030 [Tanacetum coccineum]|uniref:Reverse transcriptase domain-containing protein n=1 Tax=Tanacetum coccineum TaxID=301880 RepID=A0ABQ5A1D8_9ASTR